MPLRRLARSQRQLKARSVWGTPAHSERSACDQRHLEPGDGHPRHKGPVAAVVDFVIAGHRLKARYHASKSVIGLRLFVCPDQSVWQQHIICYL